jgi:hypothetical protein
VGREKHIGFFNYGFRSYLKLRDIKLTIMSTCVLKI